MTLHPMLLQRHLENAAYPLTKEDLIEHAIHDGADEIVLLTLEELPNRHFESPHDVSRAIQRLRGET